MLRVKMPLCSLYLVSTWLVQTTLYVLTVGHLLKLTAPTELMGQLDSVVRKCLFLG